MRIIFIFAFFILFLLVIGSAFVDESVNYRGEPQGLFEETSEYYSSLSLVTYGTDAQSEYFASLNIPLPIIQQQRIVNYGGSLKTTHDLLIRRFKLIWAGCRFSFLFLQERQTSR